MQEISFRIGLCDIEKLYNIPAIRLFLCEDFFRTVAQIKFGTKPLEFLVMRNRCVLTFPKMNLL